jgi:hypothetical protein
MFQIYAACCHIHGWVAGCDNFSGSLVHIGMGGPEQDILSATLMRCSYNMTCFVPNMVNANYKPDSPAVYSFPSSLWPGKV